MTNLIFLQWPLTIIAIRIFIGKQKQFNNLAYLYHYLLVLYYIIDISNVSLYHRRRKTYCIYIYRVEHLIDWFVLASTHLPVILGIGRMLVFSKKKLFIAKTNASFFICDLRQRSDTTYFFCVWQSFLEVKDFLSSLIVVIYIFFFNFHQTSKKLEKKRKRKKC